MILFDSEIYKRMASQAHPPRKHSLHFAKNFLTYPPFSPLLLVILYSLNASLNPLKSGTNFPTAASKYGIGFLQIWDYFIKID
jgi:hypothetical protein